MSTIAEEKYEVYTMNDHANVPAQTVILRGTKTQCENYIERHKNSHPHAPFGLRPTIE